jgi:hypothetical protein
MGRALEYQVVASDGMHTEPGEVYGNHNLHAFRCDKVKGNNVKLIKIKIN